MSWELGTVLVFMKREYGSIWRPHSRHHDPSASLKDRQTDGQIDTQTERKKSFIRNWLDSERNQSRFGITIPSILNLPLEWVSGYHVTFIPRRRGESCHHVIQSRGFIWWVTLGLSISLYLSQIHWSLEASHSCICHVVSQMVCMYICMYVCMCVCTGGHEYL